MRPKHVRIALSALRPPKLIWVLHSKTAADSLPSSSLPFSYTASTLCSMASTIELASAFIEGAPPGEVCTPVLLKDLPPDYPSASTAPLLEHSALSKYLDIC
jgi:hypothetical protein